MIYITILHGSILYYFSKFKYFIHDHATARLVIYQSDFLSGCHSIDCMSARSAQHILYDWSLFWFTNIFVNNFNFSIITSHYMFTSIFITLFIIATWTYYEKFFTNLKSKALLTITCCFGTPVLLNQLTLLEDNICMYFIVLTSFLFLHRIFSEKCRISFILLINFLFCGIFLHFQLIILFIILIPLIAFIKNEKPFPLITTYIASISLPFCLFLYFVFILDTNPIIETLNFILENPRGIGSFQSKDFQALSYFSNDYLTYFTRGITRSFIGYYSTMTLELSKLEYISRSALYASLLTLYATILLTKNTYFSVSIKLFILCSTIYSFFWEPGIYQKSDFLALSLCVGVVLIKSHKFTRLLLIPCILSLYFSFNEYQYSPYSKDIKNKLSSMKLENFFSLVNEKAKNEYVLLDSHFIKFDNILKAAVINSDGKVIYRHPDNIQLLIKPPIKSYLSYPEDPSLFNIPYSLIYEEYYLQVNKLH